MVGKEDRQRGATLKSTKHVARGRKIRWVKKRVAHGGLLNKKLLSPVTPRVTETLIRAINK
jgi:hypothetical protein